jgi:hypothetical protein
MWWPLQPEGTSPCTSSSLLAAFAASTSEREGPPSSVRASPRATTRRGWPRAPPPPYQSPSDEDMTMLGELHGGQGDQQGHPNREGGLKLIRFESTRWRPKSSLSPPQNPGPVYLELVTQDASGLHFR